MASGVVAVAVVPYSGSHHYRSNCQQYITFEIASALTHNSPPPVVVEVPPNGGLD